MEEVTLKLTVEQFALINKLLEPYIQLFAVINEQLKIQKEIKGEKSNEKI